MRRTPFVVGRGFISRRFINFILYATAAASHRPTRLRQVLPLRVILSEVRPGFHLRFSRCCFAVRLRCASLRMTRADVVETRRANGYAVRISQKVKDMLHGRYRLPSFLMVGVIRLELRVALAGRIVVFCVSIRSTQKSPCFAACRS